MTIAVDDPAKDFAYELDVQCRLEEPKPKKGEEPKPRPSLGWFLVTSWKFWALIAYIIVTVSVAEIFAAYHGENPRYKHKYERTL